MKVLYDYQIFYHQKFGGISRYFSILASQSKTYFNSTVAVKYHKNSYLKSANLHSRNDVNSWVISESNNEQELEANIAEVRNRLASGNYNIFHPTYYDDYFFEVLGDVPLVVTVYDMIHEMFPEHLYMDYKTIRMKRELIKKADKIITISDRTKKDLLEYVDIESSKIDVIYLASSISGSDAEYSEFMELPEKYILYVGDRNGYKNFYYFILSISPLLQSDRGLKIIITGPDLSKKEVAYFKAINIPDSTIIHMWADDSLLANLYSNAALFAFPSLYEGFGIPLLEAFSCGCPVVASNAGSLPEIAGDAAMFFDPKSQGEIRESVSCVLENDKLSNTLIANGIERNKEFSWAKTIEKTSEVYKSLI